MDLEHVFLLQTNNLENWLPRKDAQREFFLRILTRNQINAFFGLICPGRHIRVRNCTCQAIRNVWFGHRMNIQEEQVVPVVQTKSVVLIWNKVKGRQVQNLVLHKNKLDKNNLDWEHLPLIVLLHWSGQVNWPDTGLSLARFLNFKKGTFS